MPEIIETPVYRIGELDASAREAARAWYRDGGFDYEWHDGVYTDFAQIAEILGITLETRPVRLMGGGTRNAPCIFLSGFWSQGDGASFEASWTYAKGAAKAIRAYAPQDTKLHAIADLMQDVQRRNSYQLVADVSQSGRYVHEYTMQVRVERDSASYQDMTEDAEDIVIEVGPARPLTAPRWHRRTSRPDRRAPMTTNDILLTIRQDAAAFGQSPLDDLLDHAADSLADGDLETWSQALAHAARFRDEEGAA